MGSFGGIGVVLGENKQGQAYVVEVYKDTPAFKAGHARPATSSTRSTASTQAKWTQDEVVKRVRGPEGTKVTADR